VMVGHQNAVILNSTDVSPGEMSDPDLECMLV
jgi:hypothetical protein